MVNKRKFQKRDNSKETLKTFTWNADGGTTNPDFSFNAVLQLIENDPVARGAVNHFVDKGMEGDYSIIHKEDRKYDWKSELRLEEQFMFRTKVLRKIFLMGKLFNNVFLEIVRDSEGRTKELNILDTTDIEPIQEPNGDATGYKSITPNPITGEKAEWKEKDAVWFKFGDRTSGWAPVDMRAIWENLLLKHYVNRYVSWLWRTGQYRLIYNFENASNQDIEDWMTYARANDDNFKVPFIMKGKVNKFLLRDMKETSSLIDMLSYLDSQTLILLRVPPIDAGIPEASGRSNADAQSNNMETSIIGMKKVVADYINFELFPKINRSTVMLIFGPMNRFAESQIITIAQTMNSMNMKDEYVQEFLMSKGMFSEESSYFKEPEAPTDVLSVAAGSNPRDKDSAPSRKGKEAGTGNKAQAVVTTREDQLKKV